MLKSRLSQGLVLFLLASIGLADALFLTLTHNTGPVTCTITKGCDVVLDSVYASLPGGYPTAVLGMVFYGVMMILGLIYAVAYVSSQQLKLLRSTLILWGIVGLIASTSFIYIQGVILQSWCQYCLLSALTSTLCAGIIWYIAQGRPPHEINS